MGVVQLREGRPRLVKDTAILRLTTLGRFELMGPTGPIKLSAKKLRALLVYLACTAPVPQPRERLMTLLWGSRFDTQARQNVRQALSRLRRVVGENVLQVDDEQVSLRPGALVCDAAEFDVLMHQDTPAALQSAADLYGGAFLSDVVVDEPAWLEWHRDRHDRLQEWALAAHLKRAEAFLAVGDQAQALAAAEAIARIDGLREDACRLAMRALSASGRRADALRHYGRFAERLKQELGVGTDAMTSALAAELRTAEAGLKPLPRPQVPARPSIVVLPFENLSGDAKQDYLADGIVEDLITALSRLRSAFVIARNSSFTYKNRDVDVREVGHELGVRYVLQGSIRIADKRMRVAARLVEAESGSHVWADRFDSALTDVFALQDAITQQIVAALEPNLRSVEIARVRAKPPQSLDAYDLYLRGLAELYTVTPEGYFRAEKLLRRSLALDPQFADALSALCDCRVRLWLLGTMPLSKVSAAQDEMLDLARRAVAADPQSGIAHATEAYALAVCVPRFEEGMEAAARALDAHPNSARVCFLASAAYTHSGESAKALPYLHHTLRLDPRDPRRCFTFNGIAMNHFFDRQFEDAERWSRRSIAEMPTFTFSRRLHAASLAHLGHLDEARHDIDELLKLQPNSTIVRSSTSRFRLPHMYDLYLGGLRLAGLPER
jgi:TolB-like protein